MSREELEHLVRTHPQLYHVTAPGAWESIQEAGLLSAAMLSDRYGVDEPRRSRLLERRREAAETLSAEDLPDAVLYDHEPFNEDRLLTQLAFQGTRITLEDWWSRMSGRVFLWASWERQQEYVARHVPRDLLVIDTRSLIAKHRWSVQLCAHDNHFNHGTSDPDHGNLFLGISEWYRYWRRHGLEKLPVVEFTVLGCIPDIADHVVRVYRVGANDNRASWSRERLKTTAIWEAPRKTQDAPRE